MRRLLWQYLPLSLCLGLVGCLSFSLEFGGRRDQPSVDGTLTQTGTITVRRGETRTVYYPVPYHNIPLLTLDTRWSFNQTDVEIEEPQQRDYFRVKVRPGGGSFEVTWTAKGLPITVALPPPPIVAPPLVAPPLVAPPPITP